MSSTINNLNNITMLPQFSAICGIKLKINGTAQEALDQINSKGYAIPYQTDGRPVRKAGISFSTETLAIEGWVIA